MTTFDETATSEQVIEAFAPRIKGRTFVITGAGKPSIARVVNLTSSAYLITPFRFDDWNFSDGKTYDHWTRYGQAKTANVLCAYGLTKRLKSRGVTSAVTHPGYNNDTQLGSHLTWDDYAEIPAILKRNTGRDWEFESPRSKTQIHEPAEHARDPVSVEKLWELSERLVGQKFEY
ncbi:hypothetical protein F4818DRAFT_443919 [Hypoxylon cercidicola]|nr:hypothetical protein F4818DRAFT_443919 [Hypoxylon cercidicola]